MIVKKYQRRPEEWSTNIACEVFLKAWLAGAEDRLIEVWEDVLMDSLEPAALTKLFKAALTKKPDMTYEAAMDIIDTCNDSGGSVLWDFANQYLDQIEDRYKEIYHG